MATHAHQLVYRLLNLMPSSYQRQSLQCLFALFLTAQRPRPRQGKTKSEAGLSRFLNRYGWPTRKVVRSSRNQIMHQLQNYFESRPGRRPILYAVVDLTCLEKTGKFKGLDELVRRYNHKQGVHVAMLYLVVGPWRFPWSFRVYRGKGTPTPTQLALKLLNQIPLTWRGTFKIRVLADAGFSSTELIPGAECLGFEVLMSICCDRRLQDGRRVDEVTERGEVVQLVDLDTPITLSWFWRKHEDTGKRDQHFVIATECLSGGYIIRLGKFRWMIEACFKTLKHRFGWDCFGQGTRVGMYRWWILSFISFLLAHWQFLESGTPTLDWQEAAQHACEQLFPQEVIASFVGEMKRVRPLLAELGYEITISPIPVAA